MPEQLLRPESGLTKKLKNLEWDLTNSEDRELFYKALSIVRMVEAIVREKDGQDLQPEDAKKVYAEIAANFSNTELQRMGQLAFPQWFSADRLPSYEKIKQGVGVPHIITANKEMGRYIAESESDKPEILDLGAGTMGTGVLVAMALNEQGKQAVITGVEYTPKLVDVSRETSQKIMAEMPNINVRIEPNDIENFVQQAKAEGKTYYHVTASYVIHHLKKDNQEKLIADVFEVVKPGGSLQIADPQEGISQFNLKVLLPNEPEGIFAEFTSPDEMVEFMKKAGFVNVEVVLRDDPQHPDNPGKTEGNYTGYLVRGIKPKE
ncbi:MAG: class I SAM-dependent methyltransferase [Patescibacteria group bacterium]